jgi:hypothetical protein
MGLFPSLSCSFASPHFTSSFTIGEEVSFVYSNDPNIPAAALFVSAVGSLGFFIISCVYFFLTWFLLKRSTTLAGGQ